MPVFPHSAATIFHKDAHILANYVKPVWGEKTLDDIKRQRRVTFRVNKTRAVQVPPRTARINRDRELAKHTHCTYSHTPVQPLFIKGQGSHRARVIERKRELREKDKKVKLEEPMFYLLQKRSITLIKSYFSKIGVSNIFKPIWSQWELAYYRLLSTKIMKQQEYKR